MAYTNSPLISYTKLSPNNSGQRKYPITRISIHCVVGQLSVKTLGSIFTSKKRQVSSNYGIGYDGKIAMYVPESNRSWCTSNSDNDNRAITIEVASDTTSPYAVKDAAYKSLLDLVTDICKRNGKTKVVWIADKTKALAYTPAANEMVLTVHRWFANKSCPGDYLYSRHAAIAAEVTKRLGGSDSKSSGSSTFTPYLVKVTAAVLNVRKGPGTGYAIQTQVRKNEVFTIVSEEKGWGKLKSGAGWIRLSYTAKKK